MSVVPNPSMKKKFCFVAHGFFFFVTPPNPPFSFCFTFLLYAYQGFSLFSFF
jgi:hypothetical protein